MVGRTAFLTLNFGDNLKKTEILGLLGPLPNWFRQPVTRILWKISQPTFSTFPSLQESVSSQISFYYSVFKYQLLSLLLGYCYRQALCCRQAYIYIYICICFKCIINLRYTFLVTARTVMEISKLCKILALTRLWTRLRQALETSWSTIFCQSKHLHDCPFIKSAFKEAFRLLIQ